MIQKAANLSYKLGKRIAIGIVGFSVLIVGILMIVLPGPAFVVIPAGLSILALEFAWAQRWLALLKDKGTEVINGISLKKDIFNKKSL